MSRDCSVCGLVYEREQGYFVGAIYINVIGTESLLLLTFLIYVLFMRSISQTILSLLFVLAVVLPLIFYHHSRSLWLCLDHLLNPVEGGYSM